MRCRYRAFAGRAKEFIALWFSDPANMKRIAETTVAATEAISADAGMADSSARWFRSSWSDVQKYRDGITLDAQGMTPLMTFLGKMAPALSEQQADGYWVQSTRDAQTATAAAYGILAIPDFPNRAQLLEAGRLWQRLHLSATASHLAMQPLNQIVERTEVQEGLSARFGGELQELVGETPWRGVFLFRIGYPLQTPSASPRRSINQVMV
jgi:hypothetical protein